MSMQTPTNEFWASRELLGQAIIEMYPGLFDMDQKTAAQRMSENKAKMPSQVMQSSRGSWPVEEGWFSDLSGKTPTSR